MILKLRFTPYFYNYNYPWVKEMNGIYYDSDEVNKKVQKSYELLRKAMHETDNENLADEIRKELDED